MQTTQGTPASPLPQATLSPFVPSAERESPRGLRATIDRAPIGIAHFDPRGRFLLVNDRMCAILGYERPALLARGFYEVTFPEDIEACAQLNARLASGAIPSYTIDKRCVRKDGAVVWAHICVSAVHDETGELAFFIGIAEDVSAQRAGEEQRRQAEERLQAALQASATGTFRWDMKAGTVQSHGELDRLFDLDSAGDTRPIAEFFARLHPEDRERIERATACCENEGRHFEEDFRIVRPDGSVHCLHAVGKTFRDAQGRPAYMTGACLDVTSAWKSREKLEESEARLRALVDASPLGISAFDMEGRLLFFNEKWAQLRGLPPSQVDASRLIMTLHPDDRERVLSSWYEAVQAGRSWAETYRYVHPTDGTVTWVNGRAAPIHVKGRLAGFVATAADITSLKEAQAEQERLLQREHEAREAAERAARLREEMVATVAHDLRNPLHVIATATAALRSAPLETQQRARFATLTHRSIRIMTRLLEDLLDISRIDAGRLEVRRALADPVRLLEETRELFEARARERDIALSVLAPPDLGTVAGDRDRLVQVLSNLVENALKFTASGGHVELRAQRRGDGVEIAVVDDGIGLAPGQLDRLFDRYWKAEQGSRTGAGLGLAIARGIVEAHGGEIRAESAPGRGTTIRFTIPRGSPA